MATFRVRPGQSLAHNGAVLEAGAVVELPRRLAIEVAHLVDEVDASGQLVTPAPWQELLDQAQAHERPHVLESVRQRTRTALAEAEERLTAQQTATAAVQAEIDRIRQTLADLDAAITAAAAPPAELPSKKASARPSRPAADSAATVPVSPAIE